MGEEYGGSELLRTYLILGREAEEIAAQRSRVKKGLENLRSQLGGQEVIDAEKMRRFGTRNISLEQLTYNLARELTPEQFEKVADDVASFLGEEAKEKIMEMYSTQREKYLQSLK